MAKYRGKDLAVQWIYPGGTVYFQTNGPQTSFDTDAATDMVEVTSGNAVGKEYIDGPNDATSTLKYYDDTGASGTVAEGATQDGTFGTLFWGAQGTATGKPKRGYAAWTKNQKVTIPYDKAIDLEVQFQKSGAWLARSGSVW